MIRHHFQQTMSLMDDMRRPEWAEAAADLVVLTADYQTAGRGQGDHCWESARGENLLVGFVFHSRMEASRQKRISDGVVEAVCRTVEPLLRTHGLEVWMKPPNDIYVGGKKIAGLLIEHDVRNGLLVTTRVGIGLNVNQTEFVSDAPNPCSLATLTGQSYDREALLQTLTAALVRSLGLGSPCQ